MSSATEYGAVASVPTVVHVESVCSLIWKVTLATVEPPVSDAVAPSVIGGNAHAESPEWMPASSMCSMMPPR